MHTTRFWRLAEYDYATAGQYFITTCTYRMQHVFGSITNGQMERSVWGEIAHQCWYEIPLHYPTIVLHAFVVMPHHIHGIIEISVGYSGLHQNMHNFPRTEVHPRVTLGQVVGAYKSAVTRRINRVRKSRTHPVWKSGYHDHIIRNAFEYHQKANYILDNPRRWSLRSHAGG